METSLLCEQKYYSSCCLLHLCSLTIVTTLFVSASPEYILNPVLIFTELWGGFLLNI